MLFKNHILEYKRIEMNFQEIKKLKCILKPYVVNV